MDWETDYKPYEGKALQKARLGLDVQIHQHSNQVEKPKKAPKEDIPAYFPDEELKKAVEYARVLKRPLLLRGEPGCGKTRLAQAVAFELYGKDYRKYYFEWYIKSTTKATDGLYAIDHLARLRDVQEGKKEAITTYRSFGPLGMALKESTAEHPCVLLIDEIDKADLDFPNDLLLELDQMRFFVPETQDEIIARYPPIVFITSNDEKDLPDAFLRRCVFHYIQFPSEEVLFEIAKAKVEAQQEIFEQEFPKTLLKNVIKEFVQLYGRMKKDPNTDKLPSTSELLDWLRVIHYYHYKGELKIEKDPKDNQDKLLLTNQKIPYLQVLAKSLHDYNAQKIKKA